MKTLRYSKIIGVLFFIALFVIFFSLWYSNVSTTLTPENKKTISEIIKRSHIQTPSKNPDERSFNQEIRFIKSAQRTVMEIAPTASTGISRFNRREPIDLIRHGHGACFDQSRSLEKILQFYNIRTRHISIYFTHTTGSAFLSLITPGNPSHVLVEARTKRGWIVINPSRDWIALSQTNNPIGISGLQKWSSSTDRKSIFQQKPPEQLQKPFTYVYGLYSRHGQFYPPYNYIPDINWNQFVLNFY